MQQLARTLVLVQPYLIAIRTRGRVGRLAVWAMSGADALAKARAAVPLAPADAFHVQRKGEGDVLLLPTRGRPPRQSRAPAAGDHAHLATLSGWADIS